jgi:exodeoxyribonuclease-3
MMMHNFKIATWNVNSLRVRLPQVLTWLAKTKPDVLAIQETKLPDMNFPLEDITQAGYHAVYSGQNTYNGVAILSREQLPTDVIKDIPGFDDIQRRILSVSVGNIRILNIYVPNGESIVSNKYQYKLHWLTKIKEFLKNELAQHSKMIVLGDFNIAPTELDVYDPNAWEGHVLCSKAERQSFQALLTLGLHDCFREFAPDQKAYSWWDYRLNAFKRNMGLRIDHILANTRLFSCCKYCQIDKSTRAWERPSDHAPVVAEFTL